MSDILLETRGVSRDFAVGGGMFHVKQSLKALDGVDFSIRRNEVVGLVGESGCGKSTLARILLGLLAPSSGTVTLSGVELAGLDRKAVSRRVQPVFQDP